MGVFWLYPEILILGNFMIFMWHKICPPFFGQNPDRTRTKFGQTPDKIRRKAELKKRREEVNPFAHPLRRLSEAGWLRVSANRWEKEGNDERKREKNEYLTDLLGFAIIPE